MSQRERVIKMLREREWVSTLDMVFDYILRGGDIIFKLRRKGWVILERTKEGTPYGEYHLISEPKVLELKDNGSVSNSGIQEAEINESVAFNKQVSPAFGERDLLHLRETSGVQENGRGTLAGENRQCGNLF